MGKNRYSFRITRKTRWLDEILSHVPDHDLSDFIRELVIEGIKAKNLGGVIVPDSPQSSHGGAILCAWEASESAVTDRQEHYSQVPDIDIPENTKDLDDKLSSMYE